MLTITPRDLVVNDVFQIEHSFSAMAGIPAREKNKYNTLLCFHGWHVTDAKKLGSSGI